MEALALFGPAPAASKATLQSAVLRAYDSFPLVRLPRSLFESLVKALFSLCAGDSLTLMEFEPLFGVVSAKVAHGEPALGRLVGKEQVDVSDEWLHGKNFTVEYVAVRTEAGKRTPLFRRGDNAECCFVIAKGCVVGSGGDSGAPVAVWGESDVIGLDDMLLKQRARSYSAWIECPFSSSLIAQPLLLRVAASSFASLQPHEFLHFLSGALHSLRACADGSSLRSISDLRPHALAALPVLAVAKDTVLYRAGEVIGCVYYVSDGELQETNRGCTFCAGSLACLPEFLCSDGKIASGSLVAASDCKLVSLNFENLEALLVDADFRDLVLETLRVGAIANSGQSRVHFLSRGDSFPNVGAKLLSGRISNGVCWGDTAVALADKSSAQHRQGSDEGGAATTIAVVESSDALDHVSFCLELSGGFKSRGSLKTTLVCGSDYLPNYAMTLSELDVVAPVCVRQYVRHVRLRNERTILFVPLSSSLPWARECFAAADTILLLQSDDEDVKSEANAALLAMVPNSTPFVSRELVLLRKGDEKQILRSGLAEQRRGFAWSKFHHVRVSTRSDIQSLCRTLSGRSIGLVLGGHAEGVASFVYVGVLEAFRAHNIPLDIIGGCYSGAMVGAMYCLGLSPQRTARRIKRMQPRFSVIDPWMDVGLALAFWTSSYSFVRRFRQSVETTYSRPNGRNDRSIYAVEDMRHVSQFFSTATHAEYGLPVVLDRGAVCDVVSAALQLPVIMGGSLVCGSFSDPLPVQRARAAGAWKCFSVNVNVPISGDARGGAVWNALIDGAALTSVSHLAVSAAIAATRGSENDSLAINVCVSDVLADQYTRAQEMCQRGYSAACKVIERLKRADETFARETATAADHAVSVSSATPDFGFAKLPFQFNYARLAKIGGLVAFGVLMFFFVRRKAIEVEHQRLQDFIAGESAVHTEFVVREGGE